MFQIVSLNQATGNGDETLENVIPGEDGITFREGEEVREAIETLLKNLNPNEQRALKLRFGIPNGIVSAINEIGAELRITRDRVRQMEAKAFAKLRKSHRSRPKRQNTAKTLCKTLHVNNNYSKIRLLFLLNSRLFQSSLAHSRRRA